MTELTPDAIRAQAGRFAALLTEIRCESVRVWCSYNPDLPDDSPLQSPERVVPPEDVISFFDETVAAGIWKYGDGWNRAAIEAIDNSFCFFLGNDRDITLETDNLNLLDRTRSAWELAGFEIIEGTAIERRGAHG